MKKNGGWYAGVTPEGDIVPNKQCYAHAFVILAASSALTAGRPGAKELLEEALAVYDRYFWNEEEGLACDTWNTEFTVLDDYRGLNANMHTVEAFLAAGDVTGDKKYHIRAGRIIDHVIQWAEDNSWRIPEHFTKEWVADLDCNRDRPDDPFKPYGATPGHGIEWGKADHTVDACKLWRRERKNWKNIFRQQKNLYTTAIKRRLERRWCTGELYTRQIGMANRCT